MDNENKIDPSISRYVFFDMLYSELSFASNSKDIDRFKRIATTKYSTSIPQNEIDISIFATAYKLADDGADIADELLKYLIFDYNINEESYAKTLKNALNSSLNMQIENMFTLRKLSETLNQDLKTNYENIKRPKV